LGGQQKIRTQSIEVLGADEKIRQEKTYLPKTSCKTPKNML